MSHNVVLWAPGLLPGPEVPPLPLLDRLAGRSESRVLQDLAQDEIARYFALFSMDCPAAGDCPVAPISARSDGLPVEQGEYWLRMDPVHLVPRRAELLLLDTSCFSLEMEEANGLLSSLSEHFAERGWSFYAPQPDRWYVRLPDPLSIRHTPLPAARGRSVNEVLASGPDARYWHVLLNEAQMVLHEHPVNRAREEMGLPIINSVWFWGGGSLPVLKTQSWQHVWSDDPLLRALAGFSSARLGGFPENMHAWTENLPMGGHLLVYPGQFEEPDHYIAFEALVVLPLKDALKRGRLQGLHIVANQEAGMPVPVISLGRQEVGRWWRRSRRFLGAPVIGVPTSWQAMQ